MQVLGVFDIVFDINFDVMQFGQLLNVFVVWLLVQFDEVIVSVWFDWVVVQGDMMIVMCVVFVVFYCGVCVGYVEVGLCMCDLMSLFLEEVNCVLIG